ncbi:hypothetical protein Ptr902_02914 [Pyrenophora tritici-repentis]|nr:hypothetical protein Ptr902_02914 [Pyrenophora tritici-repentis]
MSPSMGNYLQAVLGSGCPVVNSNDLPNVKQTQGTPPASISSRDDTFHDHGSTDADSNGNGTATLSSPMSPDALNLSGLTMADKSPPVRKNEERYSQPAQRGSKYNNTNVYVPPGRDFRGNHRAQASYGRGGPGGFRNSRAWMSPDAQVQQEFLIVRNSMRRLFKNSDVAKWKLSDYVAHKEAVVASKANQLARQVESKEKALYVSGDIHPEVQEFLYKCGLHGNFEEVGNYGRALGMQTIWCNDWLNGKDEVSPWPSLAEMKWEGDDRAKTGVGRFLPLPREEGPPGLIWNQLPVVEQYPMDQVCKIPTMEDVYLPVDWDIEADHEYLWSKDLEKAMDDFLET